VVSEFLPAAKTVPSERGFSSGSSRFSPDGQKEPVGAADEVSGGTF